MYTNDQGGVTRVPLGWNQFRDIEKTKGKSSINDPRKGQVRGLYYKIDFLKPLIEKKQVIPSFRVSIKSWHYNIYNEWDERSILSFVIQDRKDKQKIITSYISDVKIMTQQFPVTIALVHRLLTTASFFIRKIDLGAVPDIEQILMLHKIHPSQRSFYTDRSSEDLALLNNFKRFHDSNECDAI